MNFERTNSGIFVPHTWVKKRKRCTAFDFFAGCGGFSLGLMQAGFEVVGANEFDPYPAITYMTNLCSYPVSIHYIDDTDKERLDKGIAQCWRIKEKERKKGLCEEDIKKIFKEEGGKIWTPGEQGRMLPGSGWIRHEPDVPPVRNFWFGDIRKLKGKDILGAIGMKEGELDLVTGGPPCQGFSKAGKQQIDDPRNNLVYEYARLIVELQPKTFVMEEVPDIINFHDVDGMPVLDRFCMLLEDGGFGRWNMLKKSLLMQAGSAGCIRSRGGTVAKKPTKAKRKIIKVPDNQIEQNVLFE